MQNVVSRIVSGVLLQQNNTSSYEYDVNYKMTTALCKNYFRSPDGDGDQLMRDIARYTEAVRPGRNAERNPRSKSFPGFVYRIAA